MATKMLNLFTATQALDQTANPPHTNITCGQSRRRGFTTSNRTRRSSLLGRVAVAYVQGSPKGGGALCVRRVVNTRLWSVPPINREAIVRQSAKLLSCAIITASIVAAPLAAQTRAQIERRYTPDYNCCMDASGGVTSEMMDCTGAEIERQDARLNQAYVMVMRPLPRAGSQGEGESDNESASSKANHAKYIWRHNWDLGPRGSWRRRRR